MKRLLGILPAFLLISNVLHGQQIFKAIIKDSLTQNILPGVSVSVNNGKQNLISDKEGKVRFSFREYPATFSFSHSGYKTREIYILRPGGLSTDSIPAAVNLDTNLYMTIYLQIEEKSMEEVIISSSRTNSRMENLPTKVEVIGEEEMEEENGIKPGNIASILGDIAGIQLQQTSATTGNADMRIQGLQGKYTQILRDGLPLFGGYSGSFSILQIPPLDLKQVELIKGASSTLYGGGAIAGMINLISKRPKKGEYERSATLNQSTLRETNLNFFFSGRKEKFGYTLFAGGNYQYAVDVNKDGFSDVPDLKSIFIHPRLFFYPNSNNTITVGYTTNFENRNGGDMQVLHHAKDSQHEFFIRNKSIRNTADAEWESRFSESDKIVIKGTASWFDRNIESNVFGMDAAQFSWFSEMSYVKKMKKNNLVAGLNISGESFRKKEPDSTLIQNYNYSTLGVFLQDDWTIYPKLTMQAGLRTDYHNHYGTFVLPRLSFLYKITSELTSRLGGGLGYKIPTVFNSDIDERDYPKILPLATAKSEKSYGFNADVNYRQNFRALSITINQAFYYTQIGDPIIYDTIASGYIRYINASKPLSTYGFETFVQAQYLSLELYLGYVYTIAKKLYDPLQPFLSLSARHKIASVVAYEFSSRFRAGLEAAFTGKQYLDNGAITPGYLFVAAMIRYNVGAISFVLNCENLLDYRQTRKESIVIPPLTNPRFKQLWSPIDGRVINLSMRFRW